MVHTQFVARKAGQMDKGFILVLKSGALKITRILRSGSRSYVRPTQISALPTARPSSTVAAAGDGVDNQPKKLVNEELKKLRFSGSRTAFDIDIDALEDHPWRVKGADISDYFNYGFNEKTWQVTFYF